MDNASLRGDNILPELVVFDCDDCLWHPETYTLPNGWAESARPVLGNLGSDKEGVVGVESHGITLQLFPGAREALKRIATGQYPGVRLAAASSADTANAELCAWKGFSLLEVIPGLTMEQLFKRGFEDVYPGNVQIGRGSSQRSRAAGLTSVSLIFLSFQLPSHEIFLINNGRTSERTFAT